MGRTKSAYITKRIFDAEKVRLRALRQDPEFQTDLQKLEQLAKDLPPAPLIPASELTKDDWQLSPNDEEQYRCWSEAAQLFLERWGYSPRLANDNSIKLFMPSPASFTVSLETGNVTEVGLNIRHHTHGDVNVLAKYYQSLRKTKKKRRHLDVDQHRIKAIEARAAGKSLRQIAKIVFGGEYRAALADPEIKMKRLTERVRYLLKPRRIQK